MKSLVYISHATRDITEEELVKILNKSRDNNIKRDVTGVLLYSNKLFIQYIEGEQENIDELLETLAGDDRHSDITIIAKNDIEKRLFGNWTMGFVSPMQDELNEIMNYVDADQYVKFLGMSDNPILEVIRRVYLRNEERSDL